MKKPSDIINQLQSTTSRLEKERIVEEAWNNKCIDFFKGVQLAYDPLVSFGIKKLPKIKSKTEASIIFELEEQESEFNRFLKLADNLRTRNLTGHAARDAVAAFASDVDFQEWDLFYSKILIKDLKCGISQVTVNKILDKVGSKAKEYKTKVFQCALAQDFEKHKKKVEDKKVLVDGKYDGVRIIAILNYSERQVLMFTRNGKQNDNFKNVIENLTKIMKEIKQDIVLDGEMISSSFQALMKQVNRKEDVNTQDAIFQIFDYIPIQDFFEGKSNMSQKQRHEYLKTTIQPYVNNYSNLHILNKLELDLGTEQGIQKFREFEKSCLEQGLEGMMIKLADAPYECKRSTNWLKLKPSLTVDLEIISIEEGTGRNKGRLGNIICEGEHEGTKIHVSVGSGYSDQERETFWQEKEKLFGMIIEVRADTISQNQDGSHSLRFPRFVRFRGLEPGEKM